MNTIFWFSATGNSLTAARRLAESLGDTTLVPIAGGVPPQQVGGMGCRVGFVFPSYYGELPRIVRAFVEQLSVAPQSDLFAVVTMGALGQGSVKAMAELLATKGLHLRYGVGIRMPANYIIGYDPALFGAKSAKHVSAKLTKADARLRRIADDLVGGKREIRTHTITAKTLYKNVDELDSEFFVTDKCTGCGLCARVCPAGNIALANGKPTWQHHCEHCVACISWCPSAAIEYGAKTARRTRYRNPRVTAAELAATRAQR